MSFKNLKVNITSSVHLLVGLIACVLLFVSSVSPAIASTKASPLSSPKSHPSEGLDQLNEIQARSEDALRAAPQLQKDADVAAKRGPNEIQGTADADQMYTPENSQEATTVMDKVEEILENITSKD
jgi:hypothetical protein